MNMIFNDKENSCGPKSPVVYESYHCVSLRNHFPQEYCFTQCHVWNKLEQNLIDSFVKN